jgi:hypothetical protein
MIYCSNLESISNMPCTLHWFAVFLVSALLAWNQSKGFVYAYYVLRTISYILSQGSIFCIAVAYAVRVFPW